MLAAGKVGYSDFMAAFIWQHLLCGNMGGINMGHDHSHAHSTNKKVLWISFFIITLYMFVEAAGGFITNSLALLADAGHMLSDSISLGIALLAFTYGAKAADLSKTYGYRRFEILAAVLNGVTLIVISLYIFYEAIKRFQHPPEVASTGMLAIAVIGLLVNILVAWIMMRGGDVEENLNMRGAYLHVISDMLGSIGAIAAALLIMFFDWTLADPLASVVVSVLVLRSGYLVTKSSLHVLMEGTPENVEMEEIIQVFTNQPGVVSIHDLHVWTITSGLNALSCHAVVDGGMTVKKSGEVLHHLEHQLLELSIHHVTIQFETDGAMHSGSILCETETTPAADHHHH